MPRTKPNIDRKRAIFLVGVILNLLLSNLGSLTIMAEILLQESRRAPRRARHDLQKKRDDDDDALAAVLAAAHRTSLYNFRRHWVETKSSHWGINVLRGIILPRERFDAYFRLSRASFNILHAFLGR